MQNSYRVSRFDIFNLIASFAVVFYTNFHNNFIGNTNIFTLYKNLFPNSNGFIELVTNGLASNLLGLLPYEGAYVAFRILLGTILLIYSLKQIQNYLMRYLNDSMVLLFTCLLLFTPINFRILDLFLSIFDSKIPGSFFAQFPYPLINLFGFSLILHLFQKARIGRLPDAALTFIVLIIEFFIHPYLAFTLIFSFLLRTLIICFSGNLTKQVINVSIWKSFWLVIFSSSATVSVLKYDSKSILGSLNIESRFNVNLTDFIIYTVLPIIIFLTSLTLTNISMYEIFMKFDISVSFFFFDIFVNILSFASGKDLLLAYQATGLSYVMHLFIYLPVLFMLFRFGNLQKLKFINKIYLFRLIMLVTKYIKTSGLVILALTLSSYLYGVLNYSNDLRPTCSIILEMARDFRQVRTTKFESHARVDFLSDYITRHMIATKQKTFMNPPTSEIFRNPQEFKCSYDSLGFLLLNGTNFSDKALKSADEVYSILQRTNK